MVISLIFIFIFAISAVSAAEINNGSIGTDDIDSSLIALNDGGFSASDDAHLYVAGNTSRLGDGLYNYQYKSLKEAIDNSHDGDASYISSGVNKNENNANLNIIPNACYYVDGIIRNTGNGSVNAPFKTLKEAIDVAKDGDCIFIAPGVYCGVNNTNLDINKQLSLINWTCGDVIFDGEGKNSMFKINSDIFNIIGLTFKNGVSIVNGNNRGILYFNKLKNSIINATFINNFAKDNGVITFTDGFDGVDFDCIFKNNIGDTFEGCLIHSQGDMLNSKIKCYAVNNNYGLYLFKTDKHTNNVTITGIYMNNNRKHDNMNGFYSGFIFGLGDSSLTISNSIILDEFTSIYATWGRECGGNGVKIDNNWFGNTRDNCMQAKFWDTDNWLFLDMDVPTGAVDNFTTQFKFSHYKSSSKSSQDFDDDFIILMEQIFNSISLSSVNATLDKTNVGLHENFTYSASGLGKGSLIAKWNKITFTRDFHNLEFNNVFVDEVNGNDVAGDGYKNRPFKSLKKAIDEIDDGGIITIKAGNYTSENMLYLKYMTLLNWSDESFTFRFDKSSEGNKYGEFDENNSTFTVNNSLSDDNKSFSQDNNLIKIPTNIVSKTSYYVNGSVSNLGNGSVNAPFKTLKQAIIAADDGDDIYIAPGIYKGKNNVNLNIDKKLSLINWTSGDVIFDGEGKNSMFKIYTDSLNISDLTFKNGIGFNEIPGGLLLFENGLKNSFIKATFINNKMPYCGVITSKNHIDGVNFDCTFINNTGGIYCGSLIYSWAKSIKNSNIKFNAYNNYIKGNLFKMEGIYNVTIEGDFKENIFDRRSTYIVFDESLNNDSNFAVYNSILAGVYRLYGGNSNLIKIYHSLMPKACYYVDGSVSNSGNGLVNSPFKTLKEAIDVAGDGDCIFIAPGVYCGVNNTNLDINKQLSLINWTCGDVIFDGEGKNSMFKINSEIFNIIGLTFKNGFYMVNGNNRGILNFNNLKNSIINATFINNVVQGTGVITFRGGFDGVDFDCIFKNNIELKTFEGCLIHSKGDMRNSNIKCYAVNNNYPLYLFSSDNYIDNINVTGIYMNNIRKWVTMNGFYSAFIHCLRGNGLTISNSIILDDFTNIYNEFWRGSIPINIVNTWFGNTRDNCMQAKFQNINNWLFLDMDVPIGAVDNFTTQFKFSLYNTSSKSSYDFDGDFIIPMEQLLNNISISSVNATLDKTNVGFHENFTYSASGVGNVSLIAKWNKITFTRGFHNLEFNTVFVDEVNGNNVAGDGFKNHPYNSLKKAIDEIDDGSIIFLKTGSYTSENDLCLKYLTLLKWSNEGLVFKVDKSLANGGVIFTDDINNSTIGNSSSVGSVVC